MYLLLELIILINYINNKELKLASKKHNTINLKIID